jgi:hypothetical protein
MCKITYAIFSYICYCGILPYVLGYATPPPSHPPNLLSELSALLVLNRDKYSNSTYLLYHNRSQMKLIDTILMLFSKFVYMYSVRK